MTTGITEALQALADRDERTEWLAGAGFYLASTLTLRGDTVDVYAARDDEAQPDGWPLLVAITTDGADGSLRIVEHVAEDEHDYDDGCDCDECREVRAESAALRRVGM